MRELLNDFKLEAAEHHQAMVAGFIELEKNIGKPVDMALVEVVFRDIHSLKGAARAVNLITIEQLSMSMENVLHKVKKKELNLRPEMFDLFYKATDTLQELLAEIDNPIKSVTQNSISPLLKSLEQIAKPASSLPGFSFFNQPSISQNQTSEPEIKVQSTPVTPISVSQDEISHTVSGEDFNTKNEVTPVAIDNEPSHGITSNVVEKETVRVATSKLYDILRQAEEMISIKAVLDFQVEQLHNVESQFSAWRKRQEELLLSFTLDHPGIADQRIEGFCRDKEFLKKHEADLTSQCVNLEQVKRSAGRAIDDLLLDIKKTLMHPFSSLLAVVPRIVRDLCKEYNKEIDLQIKGDEIEIDRRILEEMKNPLIHLIRNCIDHGIETKEVRKNAKKNESGSLRISITQDLSQKIQIRISDDGAGINTEKLLSSAIRNGVIKKEDVDRLSESEIHQLIFASGVSTSPFITDVSGRGLGMAIVAEKVEKIGGSIDIKTVPGKGTTFQITLPQTLAAFRGILVKTHGHFFIIPTASVLSAIRIKASNIKTVESKKVVIFSNEPLALVNLGDVLGLPPRRSRKDSGHNMPGLVLHSSHKKIIFALDEVFGEREGVVKNLGSQLKHVKNIAGTTLLGDGKIVPILNTSELVESASAHVSVTELEVPKTTLDQAEPEQKHLLVVEDSITVRNMLRSLLEAAGFSVKTAVDGIDGYSLLQSEKFNLVVSDIEMPRMNGFELTAKIRQDAALTDLPVVLVTTLDSKDDRQRGMDSGANAYIVKGSFEKSNLIETINRLI